MRNYVRNVLHIRVFRWHDLCISFTSLAIINRKHASQIRSADRDESPLTNINIL